MNIEIIFFFKKKNKFQEIYETYQFNLRDFKSFFFCKKRKCLEFLSTKRFLNITGHNNRSTVAFDSSKVLPSIKDKDPKNETKMAGAKTV